MCIRDRYKIDANGNPIEKNRINGIFVSYIWGYNGLFPVAKIENKSYNSLPPSLRDNIVNATPGNMERALNALRADSSLQDAMITTMTYDPLVGVTTITDPKGDTQTYFYNEFGQLEKVEDKQGNILQENKYNYGY